MFIGCLFSCGQIELPFEVPELDFTVEYHYANSIEDIDHEIVDDKIVIDSKYFNESSCSSTIRLRYDDGTYYTSNGTSCFYFNTSIKNTSANCVE